MSGPSPSRKAAACIQYSSTGFSNHGRGLSNHGSTASRGVTQSPDRAISREIEAYRGSSGPKSPTLPRSYAYRKYASGRASHNRRGIFGGTNSYYRFVNLRFPPFDGTHIDRLPGPDGAALPPRDHPVRSRPHPTVIHELLANPQWGGIWWMEADGELAGYFVLTLGYSLEFGGRFALLDEFLIEEPWQGRGIGTRALAFMEEWCRDERIPALRLEVGYENPRALALYRRAGFKTLDRHFMTRRCSEGVLSSRATMM